jgi:hypothetical protein
MLNRPVIGALPSGYRRDIAGRAETARAETAPTSLAPRAKEQKMNSITTGHRAGTALASAASTAQAGRAHAAGAAGHQPGPPWG